MAKRVIIVHGWGKSPNSDWFPWLKVELEKKGFEVLVPLMPDPDYPKIEQWVNILNEVIKEADENTILVGHSIGCQTILRFLQSLEEGKKVGKVILVAPWMILTPETTELEEDAEIADPWINTPIDFEQVKTKAGSFIAIFSDNDPFVPLGENKELIQEKLGAQVIVKHKQGHFDDESGIKQFPELLKYI